MPETNHHDLGLTRRDLLKTSAEEKNLYETAGAAVRTDLLDRLAAWGRRIDDPVCAELVAASRA
jgi:hypothetical protein